MKQVKEIIQHDSKILQKFKASQKKEEAKAPGLCTTRCKECPRSHLSCLSMPSYHKSSFDVQGILSKEGEEDKRAAIRSTFVSRFGKRTGNICSSSQTKSF